MEILRLWQGLDPERFGLWRFRVGNHDFTFPGLRHTAMHNWRLQGLNYFRIMAATSPRSMHGVTRHKPVGTGELRGLMGKRGSDMHLSLHQPGSSCLSLHWFEIGHLPGRWMNLAILIARSWIHRRLAV